MNDRENHNTLEIIVPRKLFKDYMQDRESSVRERIEVINQCSRS